MIISRLEIYSHFCCFAISFSRLHSESLRSHLLKQNRKNERH